MSSATVRSLDEMLKQLAYFEGLDARELADIRRSTRRRSFATGETILLEGSPCESLGFVISGQVRLTRSSADGRQHVMGVLGPAATFNDVPVFDGGPNSESAVAVGSTVVGLIPKSTVTALIERHPAVAKAALRHLSARQRSMGDVVEDLALRDVVARVARLLLGCIGKHRHIVERAPVACVRISHHEIASMVGSVREVVQRALKQLERDGAISLLRSRIDVRDAAKLDEWARGAR